MKKISSKTHWIIDLGLMVGFLAAFYLDLTGISLHQWLGLSVTILALVHLILHWDWVTAVFSRFFMKSSGRSRVYLLLDFLIMLGAVVIFETGLVISTWFALDLTNYADWLDIHIYASVITLGLTVVKLGLHWRWIINVAQKTFRRRRVMPVFQTLKPVPVPIPVNQKWVDRRQFLVLMGAVGGASVLAASTVLSKVKNVQSAVVTQSITTAQEAATAIPTTARAATPAVENTITPTALPQVAFITTTKDCTVRCPRGCSYPGHCRRYTDSNKNNRCDLGECL